MAITSKVERSAYQRRSAACTSAAIESAARDIPRFIELFRAGQLPVEKLLTGIIPLEEINAGFDRLHKGEVARQVILF